MGSVPGGLLWCSKAESGAETAAPQLGKEGKARVGVNTVVCFHGGRQKERAENRLAACVI